MTSTLCGFCLLIMHAYTPDNGYQSNIGLVTPPSASGDRSFTLPPANQLGIAYMI